MAMTRINSGYSQLRERGNLVLGRIQVIAIALTNSMPGSRPGHY
jgi:hypothetical protein